YCTDPATTVLYTLSLHDALPIFVLSGALGVLRQSTTRPWSMCSAARAPASSGVRTSTTRTPIWNGNVQPAASYGCSGGPSGYSRSEEHTSELQSRSDLVCRLLLE